ncbi:MAG TPA: lasso peptide biosynthesis PqqD family chaperone [Acidobacteriota bacterium]|nr:lasso peptide biosynthesis PqqD family chaperone [Acidobacteriota bacterium]
MSEALPLNLQTVVVRSPEQVSGDLDGKVVLLSVENGEYYNMNEVGSRIWALIERPTAVAALIEQLLVEFEVDRATCEREVFAFLEQLRKDRLLATTDGVASGQ